MMPAESAGCRLVDLIVPDDFVPQYARKTAEACLGHPGSAQIVRRRRKDGALTRFFPLHRADPDDTGEVAAISAIYRDIAPLTRAAEHIEFLLREVNHRSKNLLAVVQAVARQTARLCGVARQFIDRLYGAAAAIGCSHDLLVSRDWRGVRSAT